MLPTLPDHFVWQYPKLKLNIYQGTPLQIAVMTTNLEADHYAKRSIGFSEQDNSSDSIEVVNRHFSPEFRNRLDGIIKFSSLGEDTILHVVDKFLMELETQLEEKAVFISWNDDVRKWLAKRGFEKTMGARPMARVIKEKIKKPLAEELLFGELEKGGDVELTIEDDLMQFKITTKEPETVH